MNGPPVAAVVRDVSPRLAEALLTFQDRLPIDVGRARAQHAAYVDALERLGLEIVRVPAAPEHPDGVFVEDTVVVVDDLAIGTRPGEPSRRDEPASVLPALERRGYRTTRIAAPGRLDGGDVLAVGDHLYVGVGSRTDADGVKSLAAAVAEVHRRVIPVPVGGALHLKTAVTVLPDGTLVGRPEHFERGAITDRELISVDEPVGANLLVVGDMVVVSAAAPRTAAAIAARGFDVQSLAIDELEKAEAGLTCLSVLLDR